VLVTGMIPSTGKAPEDWWANTGYEQEVREQDDDVIAIYYHDVPPELASEALKRERAHPLPHRCESRGPSRPCPT
jgi:hypothetical protein